jgi:UDP-N-acetylbacillosamine N-acetyltransferase
MTAKGILILGFGGHARSVADVAIDAGYAEVVFIDKAVRPGERLGSFPVVAALPRNVDENWITFPAAGDNALRREQLEVIWSRGLACASIISRRAYLGYEAEVQTGTFIAHHAHVGPSASIGRGAIINIAAVIDHESRIGDFTHISVNTTVAGRCSIGNLVFIGAGATVIDRIRIVDRVIVGAGATVVNDITEPGTYVGSPARRLADSDNGGT